MGHPYRWDTNHTIAVTGTSAATSAVGAQTNALRLSSPVACYVAVGSTVATSTAPYLPANQPEYVVCSPGQTVAAISIGTSTGTMSVTELTR
jgi:hypothetical protein